MALNYLKGNYVKFVRGTTQLWNTLVVKDPDTLYFIIDSGQAQGALYLGSTLIAGQIDSPAISLKSLEDVLIENVGDRELLVYDQATSKWKNESISSVVGSIVTVMRGATANSDGLSGLVPQPLSSQRTYFLRGDGQWANPTAAVEVTLNTLVGTDTNKSVREIASDEAASAVAKIVNGANESFDTLKEIADWILEHPEVGNITDLSKRVTTVEEALNGKEGKDGLIKTVDSLNLVINGDEGQGIQGLTKTVEIVQADILKLNSTVSSHTTTLKEHTEKINKLSDALVWQVMTDEG